LNDLPGVPEKNAHDEVDKPDGFFEVVSKWMGGKVYISGESVQYLYGSTTDFGEPRTAIFTSGGKIVTEESLDSLMEKINSVTMHDK
jgi:hypothetical protein